MHKLWFVLAAVFASACQTAGQPPPPFRLIDLSDDYVAFYDRTEGMPPPERVAAFRREIVPLFQEFYGRERFDELTDERYERRIARSIEQFPALRERYLLKAAAFEGLLASAYGAFAVAFPDVGDIGDVYLVNSLGEMDGGARSFGDRQYFIFGADVMARVHPYEDEEPFFHHELFHIYHRSFQDCGAVWCALWREGLATYVAQSLNPDASLDHLLLTVPEPIAPAVEANLQEAVCTARARLDSREGSDMQALFSFQRFNERLPPRFGYYVGLLVAREVGRGRSLRELAHLSNGEVRPLIEESLARLATCS
jgi:hypothetical protein